MKISCKYEAKILFPWGTLFDSEPLSWKGSFIPARTTRDSQPVLKVPSNRVYKFCDWNDRSIRWYEEVTKTVVDLFIIITSKVLNSQIRVDHIIIVHLSGNTYNYQ